MKLKTLGAFTLPPEPERPTDGGPVGIVVTELDDAAAYLDLAVPVSGYVIIRTVNDVPERLGGLAILAHEALTPALRDALTYATLGA
jgi:hypothetical protein